MGNLCKPDIFKVETIIKSNVTSDHFPIFATEKMFSLKRWFLKTCISIFRFHFLSSCIFSESCWYRDDMMIWYVYDYIYHIIIYDDMILRYHYMPHNSISLGSELLLIACALIKSTLWQQIDKQGKDNNPGRRCTSETFWMGYR